jgi:hypothetical protein
MIVAAVGLSTITILGWKWRGFNRTQLRTCLAGRHNGGYGRVAVVEGYPEDWH